MSSVGADICNNFIEICSNTIKQNITTVHLDSMLHQLNTLLKCDYSILLKYNNQLNEIELLTLKMSSQAAPEIDIEDLCILTKFLFDHKNIQENSIINKIINSKQQTLYNHVYLSDILGIKDTMFHTEMSIIALPAIYLTDICGILIFCSIRDIDSTLLSSLRSSIYVLGSLLNLCQPPTKDTLMLTLVNDAFNHILDDGLLIADKTKILYTNNNATDILGLYVLNKNVADVFPCLSWPPKIDASYPHMHISSFFSVNGNYYAIRLFKQKNDTEIQGLTDTSSDSNTSTPRVTSQCPSGDLMAYLSHEIRNPIQTISSGVYVLDHTLSNLEAIVDGDISEQSTEEPSPKKESIKKTMAATMKRVEKACKNMSIIVDDVLDISKINNDALTIDWSNVDIQHFCDVLYNEFSEKAAKKDLLFSYNICTNVPTTIHTDETRLFQILSNLITNAIKYCNHGNIFLYIKYDNVKNAVLFCVSDQGNGISKEDECKLFTKYGRATSSRKNAKSNGLGLYVSQKLAQLLGGSIEFVSQNGATFTFIHPCFQPKHNIPQADNIQKQLWGNILVINNDANELSLFKLLLQCISYDHAYNLNIDTLLVDSPNMELSAFFKTKHYSIIFIDGSTQSLEILKLFHSTSCNEVASAFNGNSFFHESLTSPVIAIASTNYIQTQYVNDVIVKPFHNNDIKKLLEKHLQGVKNIC